MISVDKNYKHPAFLAVVVLAVAIMGWSTAKWVSGKFKSTPKPAVEVSKPALDIAASAAEVVKPVVERVVEKIDGDAAEIPLEEGQSTHRCGTVSAVSGNRVNMDISLLTQEGQAQKINGKLLVTTNTYLVTNAYKSLFVKGASLTFHFKRARGDGNVFVITAASELSVTCTY